MAVKSIQLENTYVDILDPTHAQASPYDGAVPEGKSYAITNLLVCNNGSSDVYFDLHIVPFGVTLSNNVTRVLNNLTLPGGETFTLDSEKIVLEAGDRLVLRADPDNGTGAGPYGGNKTDLSATVSYLEV